jgi:hypothetical protein
VARYKFSALVTLPNGQERHATWEEEIEEGESLNDGKDKAREALKAKITQEYGSNTWQRVENDVEVVRIPA